MKQIAKSAKIWEPVAIVEAGHEIIIGEKCRIGQFVFIGCKKLVMEEGAEIGPLAVLGGGGNIHLGKYSTVNYGAKLIPGTFTTLGEYMNDAIPEKSHRIVGSIVIGEGAYIGSNAVICVSRNKPNIIIGQFACVGALSYIDKDIPAYTIIHSYQTFHRKPRYKDLWEKQKK